MKYLFTYILLILSFQANAGGIGLGATRIIFPADANQKTISVINSSTSQDFLISSWIENESGEKTNDFIVTPPVYVSEKNTENSLKIVKVINLPIENQEKLYFLNVKAIPASQKEKVDSQNVFQFAVLSRIKIFIRPEKITPISNLEDKLELKNENNEYYFYNPTPYYMNMVNISIDNNKLKDNLTIKPYSKSTVSYKNVKNVKFQLVNDFGGLTKLVEIVK